MVAVSKFARIHHCPMCVSVMMGIHWIMTTAMVHVPYSSKEVISS